MSTKYYAFSSFLPERQKEKNEVLVGPILYVIKVGNKTALLAIERSKRRKRLVVSLSEGLLTLCGPTGLQAKEYGKIVSLNEPLLNRLITKSEEEGKPGFFYSELRQEELDFGSWTYSDPEKHTPDHEVVFQDTPAVYMTIGEGSKARLHCPKEIYFAFKEKLFKPFEQSLKQATGLSQSDKNNAPQFLELAGQKVSLVYEIKPKSRGIKIKFVGSNLVVVMPSFSYLDKALKFALSKEKWILKRYAEKAFTQNNLEVQRNRIFNEHLLELGDKTYFIKLEPKRDKRRYQWTDDSLIVFYDSLIAPELEQFESVIEAALKEKFLARLIDLVEERQDFWASLGPLPNSWKLSRAVTIWGKCTSRGVIFLNWRLVYLPDGLIEYVICHELSHLTHMNHSKSFWELVAEYYPDCLEAEQALKTFSLRSFPIG